MSGPPYHGRTHLPDGTDPIPGLGDLLTGSYQEQVLAEPSLIGYWPLDDASEPALDHSTSNRDLTEWAAAPPASPTYSEPGPFTAIPTATSVLFGSVTSGTTASSDSLGDESSPSSLYYFDGTDPYTFEVLAYPIDPATAGEVAALMDVYESGGSTNGMYMGITDTGHVQVARAGGTWASPVALTMNEWVHVAMTYDGTTLRLYFDGEEQIAQATAASHTSSGFLRLAQHYKTSTSWRENFHGRLAQAAVYNEALSASTIASHANVFTAGGAGGTPTTPTIPHRLLAQQQGPTLTSSSMYRVPYWAGATVEYTLSRASLWVETAGSTTSTMLIEKSSTAGVFTPVTVATLTLVASDQLDEVTTSLGTIQSGNLLRFRFTATGTGAANFHATLEGEET